MRKGPYLCTVGSKQVKSRNAAEIGDTLIICPAWHNVKCPRFAPSMGFGGGKSFPLFFPFSRFHPVPCGSMIETQIVDSTQFFALCSNGFHAGNNKPITSGCAAIFMPQNGALAGNACGFAFCRSYCSARPRAAQAAPKQGNRKGPASAGHKAW